MAGYYYPGVLARDSTKQASKRRGQGIDTGLASGNLHHALIYLWTMHW
jgi:hypothetical protein